MRRYNLENVSKMAEKLGYSASEKLNRLKDPDKKPSFDILVDITTTWPEVDLKWLLTGDSGNRPQAESTNTQNGIISQTYLNEFIQAMKDHNSFLQGLIKTNLVGISEQQQVLQAEVQAIQQWDAQIAAKGNKAKEGEALGHIQKLTAGNLKRLRKKNKPAEVGK